MITTVKNIFLSNTLTKGKRNRLRTIRMKKGYIGYKILDVKSVNTSKKDIETIRKER